MSRKSEQHLPAGLVEHQDRPVYFHDSTQLAHEDVDAARGRRAGQRERKARGVIRSMCLLVAAELEGPANGRAAGRTLFPRQPRLAAQSTRINCS